MLKERTWIYNPFDIIFPWGTGTIFLVICTYASITAQSLPARLISILAGVLMAAAVPTWYICRSVVKEYNYKTKYNLYIATGTLNNPVQKDIDSWTDDIISFWATAKWVYRSSVYLNNDKLKIKNAISGIQVIFKDEEKITLSDGTTCHGVFLGPSILIGWTNKENQKSLFRHELSHAILMSIIGNSVSEDDQHKIFADIKLGA